MTRKVGIVGARGIGERHARAYQQDPLAELVAVCDLIKERADEAAQMYGARAYTSLAEMLRHEDLDIVDVSTGGAENGSWHFEPTMEALEAGKHVLVEKPISNQIEEARQMVAKAAEKDLYLGCNLNHYFTPPSTWSRARSANRSTACTRWASTAASKPTARTAHPMSPASPTST